MDNGDEAPRADSFCAHAIADDGPFVIPDTAADPRFDDNAMGLGFYAGTPVTAGGQRIGTLCVAGEQPQAPTADDLETLRVLAAAITAHVELSRRERERAEETATLRRLGDVSSRLARVSDAAELESELCAAACELVGANAAVLWAAVPGGNLVASVDVGLGLAGTELPPGHGAGSRGRVRPRRADLPHARRGLGLEDWGAAPFQPLAVGDRDDGRPVRAVEERAAELPERELQLLELLSSEAAVAIERTTTLSELEKLTRVDALTGIGNRRAFDEQLVRELKRSEREGNPVALAMFDLDHFKAYNDTYGHPAGDRLLTEVAAAWQGCLRATDSLARYGGEEFALIAPGCTEERRGRARRPPARSRDRRPDVLGRRRVLGSLRDDRGLLARADAALYEAKVGGRDRTGSATRPGTAPAPTES